MTALPFLHIAHGDTSGRMLGQITRDFGVPGAAYRIGEDLSHGPLADGRRRMAYRKACCRCLDSQYDPEPGVNDADRQWRLLRSRVERARPEAVAVWHADSAADYVFLRMAAFWLRDCDVPLCEVKVPPRGEDHSVAIHSPRQLAPFFGELRAIDASEREARADEFLAIQARPEPLRRYDGTQLRFHPLDIYDDKMLSACATQWRPATRVMAGIWAGWTDGRNWISDVFIAARFSALIDAGQLEAQGSRSSTRTYQMRLPATHGR